MLAFAVRNLILTVAVRGFAIFMLLFNDVQQEGKTDPGTQRLHDGMLVAITIIRNLALPISTIHCGLICSQGNLGNKRLCVSVLYVNLQIM